MPRRRSLPTARRVVLGVLAAAASAVSARPASGADSVDLQVAGNATVRGTLRPADERENFLLSLPEGATVVAAVRRQGKSLLVPKLDLVDDARAEIDPAPTVTTRGVGTTLKTAPTGVPASGAYRLRVFGDQGFDGDYALKITVKARPKWSGRGAAGPGEAGLSYAFAAPAGAQARVTLKKVGRSGFVPALDTLTGPDDEEVAALSGAVSPWIDLSAGGTYSVRFHDGGEAGGDWACDVQLRLPRRSRPASIDISASELTGAFAGEQPVFGRVVDGEGGTVVPDVGGALDGASIQVPEGSLGLPVVITMSEAPPIGLPPGESPAGPVIDFGPEGTTFAIPAVVSIPFDPALYGDPANELTVYVFHESTGEVQPVLPRSSYSFPSPGVVSFPVSSFSAYVAGRTGPRPIKGDWVSVAVEAEARDDFGGASRIRVGDVVFDANGGFSVTEYGSGAEWTRSYVDPQAPPDPPPTPFPNVLATPAYDSLLGTYSVLDDRSVALTIFEEGTALACRGLGGDVMVVPPGEASAELRFLLRRTKGDPTASNVSGRWHAFFYALGGRQDGFGETATDRELYVEAGRATMNIGLDGRVAVTGATGRTGRTGFPQGPWQFRAPHVPRSAFVQPIGPDVLFYGAEQDPDQEPTELPIILRPCLGGQVLVGSTFYGQEDDSMLLLLVRESSGRRASALHGISTAFTFGAEAIDAKIAGDPQRVAASTSWVEADHDGVRGLKLTSAFDITLGHDGQGRPTSSFVTGAPVETTTYTLAGNGAYATGQGLSGAVTPDLQFLVGVYAKGSSFELTFALPNDPLVKSPRN